MGCCQSEPPVQAYYEPTGELVQYENPKKHSPKQELAFVSANDQTRFSPSMDCYVISAHWHSLWLDFATKIRKDPPPPVDNHVLLDPVNNDKTLKNGLKHKKDFRPISKAVWQYYFKKYGGGPVILFQGEIILFPPFCSFCSYPFVLLVPGGYSEESYLKGHWIKKVELSKLCTIITPSSFPEKSNYTVVNPMGKDSVAEANASLAANLMLNDLSRQKFAQAKELQKEINASNAEAIGALMAKDLGKKKMEEAKQVEKEQNLQESIAAANVFAGNLSEKRMTEAKAAGESAKVAQQEEAVSLFAKGSIKKRFKESLANGKTNDAKFLAATMLKNAWKGKKARERVKELKQRKQQLLEEAMARKLQSRYRTRLAKRKVEKLRAEKQRLREQGAAIMLQSNWRIKKSKDKVKRLKEQRQRLLEEGAALKVQSRWRIKQANRRVGVLRDDKNKEKARLNWAKTKVLNLILLFRAKRMYWKLLATKKQIYIVHLKSAKDINVGDVNSSDPYVLLHVESNSGQDNHLPSGGQTKSGNTLSSGSTVSLYRSKVIYNTLNPVWDEQLFAVNASCHESIVLTLMDKDNFSSDDFLGQVCSHLPSWTVLFLFVCFF
jgi:hypothetical protein